MLSDILFLIIWVLLYHLIDDVASALLAALLGPLLVPCIVIQFFKTLFGLAAYFLGPVSRWYFDCAGQMSYMFVGYFEVDENYGCYYDEIGWDDEKQSGMGSAKLYIEQTY